MGMAKENLSRAVREYLLDRVNTGIATPGQIERYLMYCGTKPGTPLGEAMRFLMQFKAFPLTFIMSNYSTPPIFLYAWGVSCVIVNPSSNNFFDCI
jgi:hypothetical protein